MIVLSASEEMCLDYIRRHEKAEDGVDLNDMVRGIGGALRLHDPETEKSAVAAPTCAMEPLRHD